MVLKRMTLKRTTQSSKQVLFMVLFMVSASMLLVQPGLALGAETLKSGLGNILVIPEYDQDSLAASHRAYKTAGAKIQDQLAHEFQFYVYDGSARQLDLQCQGHCDGLARAQLIQTLRAGHRQEKNSATKQSVRSENLTSGSALADYPPIDVLVFYHIMVKDTFSDIGVKRLLRVSSLAIDMKTGKTIAYDDGGQQQALYINPAEDLTNWTLSIANRHARDSAAYLGERLFAYSQGSETLHRVIEPDAQPAPQFIYLLMLGIGALALVLLVCILLQVMASNRKLRQALAVLNTTQGQAALSPDKPLG